MSAIILDADLKTRLNGLNEQLEVRDDKGVTVGHFVPAALYRELLYAWARTQFSDPAERERARQEYQQHGGMTTAEAVAHLEQVALETPRP